ncbi:MAG: SusC/RagA family TonB-linked outer membrane protein, partial [Rikenellaceae bacterium]|nr:SusC/RagA family TonB-linked outer membrane protein [Rikenellaceae bacterium]
CLPPNGGRIPPPPRITFEASWALQQPERTYEFLGAEDYIRYVRTAVSEGPHPEYNFLDGYSASSANTSSSIYSTRHLQPGESVPAGWKSMTDPLDPLQTLIFQDNLFVDEVFKNALWQNYYVGLDGGREGINYAASIGYTDDKGVAVGTNFSRFSARMNADVKINRRLTFKGGVDFGQTLTNQYASQYQVISRGLYCPPTQRLYYDDGTPTPGYNASSPNPLYYAYLNDNDQKFNKLGLNGSLEWEMIDGLKATFQSSLYTAVVTGDYFTRANEFNGSRPASTTLSDTQRKKLETFLTYNKTFADDHSFSAMAGYSYQASNVKSVRAAASGANSDKIGTLNAAPTVTEATSQIEEQVMIGYFGRLTYDFRRKYMLTFTFRKDGSSLFAKGNQWGFFPGASAGWAVSDEPFMRGIRAVDNLKLRVSYGQTGNNAIGLYDALGQYSVNSKYDGGAAILPASMPNQDLTWETSTQLDLGIDLSILNNSIQLSVDYFNKETKNLLFSKTLPNTTGFSSVLTNVGKVRFNGFDIELSSRNIHTNHFRWDSRITWSYVRNKVIALPDNGRERNRIGGYTADMPDGTTLEFGGIAEGEKLYRFYGYQTDYIIETMEQADAALFDESSRGWRVSDRQYIVGRKDVGDYTFKDLNGDGRINGQDMFYMGSTMPHSTGGLNNTFTYKNLTLNVFMDWALGHSICDQILSRQFVNFFANNASLSKEVLKTWKEPGDGAKYARFSGNDSDDTNRNFHTVSNVFTQKADYLCIREISLVYNLPSAQLQKWGIHNVALTLAGNNLHYFTKIIGISPETGTSSTYGDTYFSYPPIRKFSVGLKVTF